MATLRLAHIQWGQGRRRQIVFLAETTIISSTGKKTKLSIYSMKQIRLGEMESIIYTENFVDLASVFFESLNSSENFLIFVRW